MTTNWVAVRQLVPVPTHLALAGLGTGGIILTALDAQESPSRAVTTTISAYASTPFGIFYQTALLATVIGVGLALLSAQIRAQISGPGRRPGGLLLMATWPVGIAIATLFDEHPFTLTGSIHNVAVGAAIVGVHLAAVRIGWRPLIPLAAIGAACMAVMLTLIVISTVTGTDQPVGLVERILVIVSSILVVGTLREHNRRAHLPHGSLVRTAGAEA